MAGDVKHTPGPWEYRDNCIYPTSRQRCIARMDWHIRDEVDDANARLIAAAPDMLEAAQLAMDGVEVLDLLIASIEEHGNYSVESTLGFLNQARCAKLRLTEAIAKATGAS